MKKEHKRVSRNQKGRHLKKFAILLLAIAVISHIFFGFKGWQWALYIIGGAMLLVWFIFYLKGTETEHNIALTGKFKGNR